MLQPGDRRLAADLAPIDDRGLEHAEALIHEMRHERSSIRSLDDRIPRALAALRGVRALTKRAA